MKTGTNFRPRLFRRTALALGILLALVLASLVLALGGLAAPNAGDYTLSWASVDGGGVAQAAGGHYTLSGSVGQPDAGDHGDGSGYRARGGFMAAFAVPLANLGIAKSVVPGTAAPGDAITYTLVFSNTGDILAHHVVITDRVPISVTVASLQVASSVEITATGSINYVWQVQDLDAGEGGVITITGMLSNSLPGGNVFTNSAEIAARVGDYDPGNDEDSAIITLIDAELGIGKDVSDPTPDPGATIAYTITVTNHGPDDATGVVVSDTLPLSVTNVTSRATQGEYVNPVWDVGNLAKDESATLRITGTVWTDAPDGTIIANTAVISASDQGDSGPEDGRDDDADIVVRGAELAVVKTVDDYTPREGYTVTYAITVTNDGFTSTVVISDLLPSGVSCVLSSTTQGDYTPTSGAWDVGELVGDGRATLHVTATVDAGAAGTTITNTAAVSSTSLADPDPLDDRDDAFIHAQAADAVIVTVMPGEGGDLDCGATIKVPANAVADSITLICTPATAPDSIPSGWLFAGHAFNLDAYLEGVLQPGFVFMEPVTIAIHYSDEDVAGLQEDELKLECWNGGTWEDAVCGEYEYHPDENWMAVPICHLTPFALLGRAFPVGGVTVLASSWL
jgi:uncharacterized repeat protein (TIGR01451 family)